MRRFPNRANRYLTLQLLALKAIADYMKNNDHYLHPSTMQRKFIQVRLPYILQRYIRQEIIRYRLHIPTEYTFKCRINKCQYNNINELNLRAHQFFVHGRTIYPYRRCPICQRVVTKTQNCHHITKGDIPKWMKKNKHTLCWCGKRFHSRQQYITHYERSKKQETKPIEDAEYTD